MAVDKAQSDEAIKVVIRVRPLNSKEIADKRASIVTVERTAPMVHLHQPDPGVKEAPKSYTFDHVFGTESTQQEVYDAIGQPIVESIIAGYNGTIFAYGQTGTGKTHTMDGGSTPELQGITPKSFEQIFKAVTQSDNKCARLA